MTDEGPLADEPFAASKRADGTVVISHLGKPVTLLRAAAAERFLARFERADAGVAQQLMARVVPGGAPQLLQELARTYIGPEAVFPAMPNPPPGYVTRIAVKHISGIGPWTRDGETDTE